MATMMTTAMRATSINIRVCGVICCGHVHMIDVPGQGRQGRCMPGTVNSDRNDIATVCMAGYGLGSWANQLLLETSC